MEEIFEKIEELFKSKNIEFKTIEINDEKIEKIIKEIIDNENEIIKTPKKNNDDFLEFVKNSYLSLEELDGLMSLDKKLSLKVVNNKIQVIENYINEILIELDYTAKNLLLISYLNFKISSEEKFEKEIKNNNNKGVIYSEIIDLFTKIFEEEKINLNLNGYGNLINNKFYFRKFPKDSQIKNVLRIYDNFGINEIGKAIDIDRKYEEVFLKFKKENHEDYEPTIKDFFDFLLKDIKK